MSKETIGKFYEVSRDAIDHVINSSDSVLPGLAYLTLKRYQQKHDTKVTTGGRPALQRVLGISDRKTRKVLEDLKGVAWGASHHDIALTDVATWNEAVPSCT